jgi:kumamolisin
MKPAREWPPPLALRSSNPDIPATCPHVTGVGGTAWRGDTEIVWPNSGVGPSRYFAAPSYAPNQSEAKAKRHTPDLALNAETRYHTVYLGQWDLGQGTSYAAPIFAGLVAVTNELRNKSGKPIVGFLNSTLARDPSVQASFLDIVEGTSANFSATPGWDRASGYGAPNASKLSTALP